METGGIFTYYIPTKILFGCGKIHTLHTCELPGEKALIVITAGKSTRRYGYLDMVQKELDCAGVSYTVYDRVLSNPVLENVEEGVRIAKENECDFVVGLGGGSAIDAAKAIALMTTNPGQLWDYMAAGSGKGKAVEKPPLPVVAVTTTAGTGTEADPAFVITNPETNEKMGLYTPGLFPVLSIVDPELMISVPPEFTAYQGFDALFHSTEGYISNKAHAMSDMFCLQAIEVIGGYLALAVSDGNDLTAREKVALGNTLSGMQLSVGSLTSAHALEHALSAYHPSLAHGAGLVMISVAYYTHFAKVPALRERFLQMAEKMGVKGASDPMQFVNALKDLITACGLDDLKMSDYGITPEEFPKFVENARYVMRSKFDNDAEELTDEDCIRIYTESYR